MPSFHTPIIQALDHYIRNPSDAKVLYDTVEKFCMDNFRVFDEPDSTDSVVEMYDSIQQHVNKINSKSETKIINDNINIPRFIQAILFKESVRKTTKLSNCTVKQFQEILYYYRNRLGTADYKKYQTEFEDVFQKVYIALDPDSRSVVEKSLEDEDLPYRLKKLMKTAVQQAQALVLNRANVGSTLLQSLEATQKKVASDVASTKGVAEEKKPEEISKASNKTTKTRKSAVKAVEETKAKETTAPVQPLNEEHTKELQKRMPDVDTLLSAVKDTTANIELKGKSYHPSDLCRAVGNCIDFEPLVTRLISDSEDTDISGVILIDMILESGREDVRQLIIDGIIGKFFEQVVKPVGIAHTPPADPMMEELQGIQEMMLKLQESVSMMASTIGMFGERLKERK